jgi:hypothetical protein
MYLLISGKMLMADLNISDRKARPRHFKPPLSNDPHIVISTPYILLLYIFRMTAQSTGAAVQKMHGSSRDILMRRES